MSGWKRFSVPRGDSVSKARNGTLMRAEIVEQRARDGGFADTAFIGADENDCWLGHRSSLNQHDRYSPKLNSIERCDGDINSRAVSNR